MARTTEPSCRDGRCPRAGSPAQAARATRGRLEACRGDERRQSGLAGSGWAEGRPDELTGSRRNERTTESMGRGSGEQSWSDRTATSAFRYTAISARSVDGFRAENLRLRLFYLALSRHTKVRFRKKERVGGRVMTGLDHDERPHETTFCVARTRARRVHDVAMAGGERERFGPRGPTPSSARTEATS